MIEQSAKGWPAIERAFLDEFLPRLLPYSVIGLAAIILFLPGEFLPPLSPRVPLNSTCSLSDLCSSGRSPWGILSSQFLFDGWMNAALFVQIALLFVFSNFPLSPDEIKRRSTFALEAMFASAMIASALLLLLRPEISTFGTSGVTYSFFGVLTGFSVLNFLPPRGISIVWEYYTGMKTFALVALNSLIFLFIAFLIFGNTRLFLNVGPGIDVFAHGVGFLLAFGLTFAYWFKVNQLTPVRNG